MFYTDSDLDYTIVRVKPRRVVLDGSAEGVREVLAGSEFGFVPLHTNFHISDGQLTHIVQHPQGRPKELALHENKIDGIYNDVIRYTADTEPGSSGSPVFSSSWKLIALHHSEGERDADGKWKNNEGIRIDRIIESLKKGANAKVKALVKELKL
jgi:endonuclease G